MKILLIGEYSGFHNELKRALVALGHDVTLAAGSDFWKGYSSDISLAYGKNIYSYKLRQLYLPFSQRRKFVGFDVVHLVNFYTLPRSPLLNYIFIKFLKKHNGIVTIAGAGDDPFFVKYSADTMRYNPITSFEKYDLKSSYYMRKSNHLLKMHEAMSYIDGVIPIMFEYYSTFCAAGYENKVFSPVPIPINTVKFQGQSLGDVRNGPLTFFHGLNRPGFKGTFLIEECFEKLARKYPADVKCLILGKLPFDQYLKIIADVHVSVDQVFSYSLAMNALYSMAQGKIVVGGAERESAILYGGVLPPAYNAMPDRKSLLALFEQIIEDRHILSERSDQGKQFVKTFHDPIRVGEQYCSIWKGVGC